MSPIESLAVIEVNSLEETDRLGQAIALRIPDQTCLGLIGTLGAGKTRLAQAIIAANGIERASATSPTFALLQSYVGSNPQVGDRIIHHLDAYRLRDDDEFFELGIEDFIGQPGTLTLIEWADRVADCLPAETLWIEIDLRDDSTRCFQFRGRAETWNSWCESLSQQFQQH